MASRFTTSAMAAFSARSDFRNLSRAGVAENRSRTSTRVPALMRGRAAPRRLRAAVDGDRPAPRRRRARALVIVSAATAPIEGSASPRKPSVRMSNRSSSASLEVAWRSTASASSSARMPRAVVADADQREAARRPSRPRSRVAPASSAFSTSSLTTLAGRSTTSPAAMRLTMSGESWRTGTASLATGARSARTPLTGDDRRLDGSAASLRQSSRRGNNGTDVVRIRCRPAARSSPASQLARAPDAFARHGRIL